MLSIYVYFVAVLLQCACKLEKNGFRKRLEIYVGDKTWKMHKLILISIAFLVVSPWYFPLAVGAADSASPQAPQVRFISTEPLNILYFSNWLSAHSGSHLLFGDFQRRHPLSSEETTLLSKFKCSVGDVRIKLLELETAAAGRNTLSRLLEHLPSSFTLEDKIVVKDCLNHFEPLYQNYIWCHCVVASKARIKQLKDISRSTQLCEDLQRVKLLCQSSWPNSRMLTVAVVMLPDESDPSKGHDAHCDVITPSPRVDVCAPDTRIDGRLVIVESMPDHKVQDELGTVFHELCHSLWLNRSVQTVDECKGFFLAANGAKAYEYLQEALPTALGSGWYATLATGTPSRYWYNSNTIKPYAEGLLPLFEKYLDSRRTIDAEFAREAKRIFDERCPQ
jgi:hypothetical protein